MWDLVDSDKTLKNNSHNNSSKGKGEILLFFQKGQHNLRCRLDRHKCHYKRIVQVSFEFRDKILAFAIVYHLIVDQTPKTFTTLVMAIEEDIEAQHLLLLQDPVEEEDPLLNSTNINSASSNNNTSNHNVDVQFSLRWTDVSYSIKDRKGREKQILSGVSGVVHPGEMVAIMGPNGSGKTTLLNILAGRVLRGEIYGKIEIGFDGHPLQGNADHLVFNDDDSLHWQERPPCWKRMMSYVEQESSLYPTLTVKETILFTAHLKLEEPDPNIRERKCDRLMEQFGLTAVKDTIVGDTLLRGVSGGEKRRVAICNELISELGMIFLDEPTSGVDTSTSLYLCTHLKDLARHRRTAVLLTIHQPRQNLLHLFDKILLMTVGGRMVFFGTIDQALNYFKEIGFECPEHENPGDYFLDLVTMSTLTEEDKQESKERIAQIAQSWEDRNRNVILLEDTHHPEDESHELQQQSGNVQPTNGSHLQTSHPGENSLHEDRQFKLHSHPRDPVSEFGLLLHRSFLVMIRDYPVLIGAACSMLLVSLLLGFIFFQLSKSKFEGIQGRLGLLFFIVAHIIFSVMMPQVPVFALDRAVIRRERYASTYRVALAYMARLISILPYLVIINTIFCFIIYYIAGLRTDGFQYFIIFWATIMALVYASLCLGLLIAGSVKTVQMGQIVGPMVMVVLLIFAGNLVNSRSITWILRWIQYTSIAFYGYEALIQNELHGQTFTRAGTSGDAVLDLYDLNQLPIVADSLAVLGLGLILMVAGYVAVYYTTKPGIQLKTLGLHKPSNNDGERNNDDSTNRNDHQTNQGQQKKISKNSLDRRKESEIS